VGTEKRARQKELHRSRLETARAQEDRQQRRAKFTRFGIIAVLAVGLVVLVNVFSGDDDTSTTTSTTTTSSVDATTTTSEGELVPATLTGLGPGNSIVGDTPCPEADGSSERTTSFEKAPPTCIDASKNYTATFDTTKGEITVALDAKAAPKTVNNFVVLARYHFFDVSPIFRLVHDFAAQFGDPAKSPSNRAQFGYTIPDELPAEGSYKVGSLAMANTGSPDSGGAQMFFITGPNGVSLAPSYSLFGQVTEGLDVLQAINQVPSVSTAANDGAPTEQVTIEQVTISES
jgi:cyclophilin family peptidyl-prolyl cis-trans isomerase